MEKPHQARMQTRIRLKLSEVGQAQFDGVFAGRRKYRNFYKFRPLHSADRFDLHPPFSDQRGEQQLGDMPKEMPRSLGQRRIRTFQRFNTGVKLITHPIGPVCT